jgi:hypothetical protein
MEERVMYARWIDEDKYVGPKFKRVLAIKKGEVRKVHAKEGNHYILEGRKGGTSSYGWCHADQIELVNYIEYVGG